MEALAVRSTSACPPSAADELQEFPLLSSAECDEVQAEILNLRSHWLPRHPELPFFTLGAASYLDAAGGRFAAYKAAAVGSNRLLVEHFGWLHERLRTCLRAYLGTGCRFTETLARPGFHIFLGGAPLKPPSIHYDRQYEHVDWRGFGEVDVERQLSFTLSVRLPAAGSGLLVWPLNDLQLRHLAPEERLRMQRENRTPSLHRYHVGSLVVHSGHQLHQIAPMKDMKSHEARITLQGHALPAGSEWILYW